jgi:hypothetical protein
MIKFFRHIRKQLLTENKFSRYMLYALGEILLLVIGILIALQVNNWNEERKNNLQERRLLSEVQKELDSNIDKSIRSLLQLKTHDSLISILDFHMIDLDSLAFSELFYYMTIPNETVFTHLQDVAYENYANASSELSTSYEAIASGLAKLYSEYFRDIEDNSESLDLNRSYADNVFSKRPFKNFSPDDSVDLEEMHQNYRDFIYTNTEYAFYLRAYQNKILFKKVINLVAFISQGREVMQMISQLKDVHTIEPYGSQVSEGPVYGKYVLLKNPYGIYPGDTRDTLMLQDNRLSLHFEANKSRPDITSSLLMVSPKVYITYDFQNLSSEKPYFFIDRIPTTGNNLRIRFIDGMSELEKVAEID